jgi:hypothetical protein
VLLLTGCSSSEDSDPAPAATPEASVVPESPPPPAPRVGSCHDLTVSEATDPVDASAPVPCSEPHTSVTIEVGRLTPVVDGHLLAVDSPRVRAQIAGACPDLPGARLGGDRTTQRLSTFEVVWFGPSLEEADAGASWYRCDVVALRSQGRLLALPARLPGVLDRRRALDRFGTCGTAAPRKPGFARVACSERHSWRAVDVVELPREGRYLARSVTATGNARCRDIASERADGALRLSWSFEWPTRAQWASGQRHGLCWVPEA